MSVETRPLKMMLALMHGLVPALMVDDAEATVDEGDVDDDAVVTSGSVAEASCAVGAAVFDGFVERVEPGLGDGVEVRGRVAVAWVMDSDDARDAAHG